MRSVVIGTGSYLPEKIVSNSQLAEKVETSDEWIVERTGIRQRHIAADGEMTSDMAAKAALKALESAKIQASEVDLIVLATTTPDNTFPSTATKVQAIIGTSGAAFDVQAVCAGFIYALSVADSFIQTGKAKKALVIGADILTRIVDWNDRATCILFGDGAGAVLLSAENTDKRGIVSTNIHSDGKTRDILYVDGGVASTGTAGKMRMVGKEVFKHAVQKLAECTEEALKSSNLKSSDVDWVIPHQANMRILEATVKRLELPMEKLIATVDMHANTSAASIPLALDVAARDGRIKPGQLLALQAIGGGLAWGSCLIRW